MTLFLVLIVTLLCVVTAWKSNNVRMKCNIMLNDNFFGKQLTKSVVALLSTVVIAASPVNAAGKSPLFLGGSYSEVIDPKDATFNDEFKNSEDVKAGVSGLKNLIITVGSIKADLAKNSNVDLTGRVATDLNAGKVRLTLNKYNQAFSEDTQRGTDRLIRGIVQDIQEIERDVIVKEGKTRSESKIKNLSKRLDATEAAFKDLAAFYK